MIEHERRSIWPINLVRRQDKAQDGRHLTQPLGKSASEHRDNSLEVKSLVAGNKTNERRKLRPPEAVVDREIAHIRLGGDDLVIGQQNQQTEFILQKILEALQFSGPLFQLCVDFPDRVAIEFCVEPAKAPVMPLLIPQPVSLERPEVV